eukprot:5342173-Pyramimonas_sp.AAC.1
MLLDGPRRRGNAHVRAIPSCPPVRALTGTEPRLPFDRGIGAPGLGAHDQTRPDRVGKTRGRGTRNLEPRRWRRPRQR